MQTKQKERVICSIEKSFKSFVLKDKKLKSAFLMVHSEKNDIHLNIAGGSMKKNQPAYMASVGKVFTSVLINLLYENDQLSFDDGITKYLDPILVNNLHVYKGKDYTDSIKIKHLLNHTSGLSDNFYLLLNKLLVDRHFKISPEEAIAWGKIHQDPHFPPGKGFKYSNTNYQLLGLIIEKVKGIPFHIAMKQYIFEPLGMMNSSVLHNSEPLDKDTQPLADFYFNENNITNHKGYADLAYAGGNVVSTGEDLLKFIKALVTYQLVKQETLEKMMDDKVRYGLGIEYGYGIMQFKTVPLLMPEIFNVWGHAGATGAYMFYHPKMDTYLIGTFNDFSYERKGVKFMLMKVINQLKKLNAEM
ncbi:beta-lactamase family protein [Sporosarcina sp. Marseille-Q4063]|uniref:serine hydrolase domain-containing protein n=1 Tax=Sporosarcina sp. Marseille-Q4063 TaxID=2810514 RepID=UPI001BAEA81C|nr:serine hydrolase domain-containing protein [Sporosarcina sp. Marseille-Q4063]QUW22000.1 beta-lactamase family protein [Sporosarcina sp. Marseille-Q4063]